MHKCLLSYRIDVQSYAKINHSTDSSQHSSSLEPTNSKIEGSRSGSSIFQIKIIDLNCSFGTKLSFPRLLYQSSPSKKKPATSQRSGLSLNLSL